MQFQEREDSLQTFFSEDQIAAIRKKSAQVAT
jgi:hypothetical protein